MVNTVKTLRPVHRQAHEDSRMFLVFYLLFTILVCHAVVTVVPGAATYYLDVVDEADNVEIRLGI